MLPQAALLYGSFSKKWEPQDLGWVGPGKGHVNRLMSKELEDLKQEIKTWKRKQKKREAQRDDTDILMINDSVMKTDCLNLFKRMTGNEDGDEITEFDIEKYVEPTPWNNLSEESKKKLLHGILHLQVGCDISQKRLVNRRIISNFIEVCHFELFD